MSNHLPPGVEFDSEHHQYKLHGVIVPGVTSLLGEFYYGPANSKKSAWGTAIHDHIYHHLLGDLDESRVSKKIRSRIDAFDKALAKLKIDRTEARISEYIIVSERHDYCGCLDYLFFLGRTDMLLELKTGERTDDAMISAGLQLGGYGVALCEMKVTSASKLRGAAVYVGEDGDAKIVRYDMREVMHTFLAYLTVQRFKQKIKGGLT